MSSSTSRLDVLAEVCGIAPEKTDDIKIDMAGKMKNDIVINITIQNKMKDENLMPPKKRKSYFSFSFLNDMPSPTMPTPAIPKEGNELGKAEVEVPLPPKKRRSLDHYHIQQFPNSLLEECRLLYPKKPRSKRKIRGIDQKLGLASTSATTTQSHHHHINNVSLKIKCDDIDDDQDWGATEKKKKKKKKKKAKFSNNRDKNVNLDMKKKRVTMNKGKAKVAYDLSAPAELPEKFKNVILGLMHGTRLQLLMQKSLTETDIDGHQGRLLLPRQQTESKNFLKRNEKDQIKTDKLLRVQLIDPELEPEPISLGLWKMSSDSKTDELDDPKRTYVLKSKWNHIVKKHRLGKGDVVQVWSFRVNPRNTENGDDGELHLADTENGDEGVLHLALVLVNRGDWISEAEGSKESPATASTNGGSSSVCNNGASSSTVQ